MGMRKDFAVIFDMDGVLVDSNEAHYETFRKLGEDLGQPYPRELWARSIGMHNNAIFPLWLGPGLSEERALELAARKEAMYRELAADILKPVRGAVELARALHDEGVPIAVGSSGPRLNVELALRVTGLGPFMRTVVCGDDVKHGKPSPDIFLKAAERLGHLPAACVVIEDAPQGIEAALAAGMKVVGLRSEVACDLSRATRVVGSLADASPAMLRELLG